MFALGVLLYLMLFKRHPFYDESFFSEKSSDYSDKIKKQKISFKKEGVQISDETTNLLIKMLKSDSSLRLTFSQLHESPKINNLMQCNQYRGIKMSSIDYKKK